MLSKLESVKKAIIDGFDVDMFVSILNILFSNYEYHLKVEQDKKKFDIQTLYKLCLEYQKPFEFIKILVENDANVNDPTPITYFDNFHQLKFFFEKGLEVKVYPVICPNKDYSSRKNIILNLDQLLIYYGSARKILIDEVYDEYVQAHNLLTFYCKQNSFEAVEYLVKKSKMLVYHWNNHLNRMDEHLLKNGANPRAINNDGNNIKYWILNSKEEMDDYEKIREKMVNLLNKYLNNDVLNLLEENERLKKELEESKKLSDAEAKTIEYIDTDKVKFHSGTVEILNQKLEELQKYKKLGSIQQVDNYKKLYDKVKGEEYRNENMLHE